MTGPIDFNEEDLQLLQKEGYLTDEGMLTLYRKRPDLETFIRIAVWWAMGIGMAFFLAGVIFFFAWNWSEMDKWSKFGLVGTGILIFLFGSLATRGRHLLLSDLMGLGANVMVGVFLAVFGQTYQTGADVWNLFFGWAVLISPWVIASRYQANWLLWGGLLNLSLWLALGAGIFPWGILLGRESSPFLLMSLLPVLMMELRHGILRLKPKEEQWLKPVYGHLFLQSSAVTFLTITFIISVFHIDELGRINILNMILYIAYLFWMYWVDWRKRMSVSDLVTGTLSFCIAAVSAIGRLIAEVDQGQGAFLLMFFVVFGVFSGAGAWLRNELKRPRGNGLEEVIA